MGLWSLYWLPDALIETLYFRDIPKARRALAVWLTGAGPLSLAFCFALFVDHIR